MPVPDQSEHARAVGEMMRESKLEAPLHGRCNRPISETERCSRPEGHDGECNTRLIPERGRELSQAEASAELSKVVNTVESRMATDRMLQFFKYEHLPPHLQRVSAPFGKLAQEIVDNLPSNPERTVALRKLLESKDAAVRAVLYQG